MSKQNRKNELPKRKILEKNGITIYDASQIGAERFKNLTGNIPAHIEFAEAMGVQLNDQRFPDFKWEDIGSWKDVIAVFTSEITEEDVVMALRIPTKESFTVPRPAYGDEKVTDALGYALCTAAITGSWLNIYASQLEQQGNSPVIRTSPFLWITPEQSRDMHLYAKEIAKRLGKFEVFEILN